MSERVSGESFHRRLLAGDRTASSELVAAYVERLIARLKYRFRDQLHTVGDPDLSRDAATDALMDYILHPGKYRPEKRGLFGYLEMAASRDLINKLTYLGRRADNEDPLLDVELPDTRRNTEVERLDEAGNREAIRTAILSLSSARDREVALLMFDGERSTEVFARVLGVMGLPDLQRQREVKRHKDRLKKHLQRHQERPDGR